MLRYVIPLILVISSANSWRSWSAPKHQLLHPKEQVASESQVKFALENKFDDTGPGAKQPEYAYHTYKNLEDALIAYLNDPDTKLPEHEREKAINKLTQQDYYSTHQAGLFHKDEQFQILQKPQFQHQNIHTDLNNFPIQKHFYAQDSKIGVITGPKGLDGIEVRGGHQADKKLEAFKFQKVHSVKGNPLSLAHYMRDRDLKLAYDHFDSHPRYMFSYGVNILGHAVFLTLFAFTVLIAVVMKLLSQSKAPDWARPHKLQLDKTTGDSKTAQESRDGGNVHGFYSFIDSDGKTRTVHYTADDRQGFRANVQKT